MNTSTISTRLQMTIEDIQEIISGISVEIRQSLDSGNHEEVDRLNKLAWQLRDFCDELRELQVTWVRDLDKSINSRIKRSDDDGKIEITSIDDITKDMQSKSSNTSPISEEIDDDSERVKRKIFREKCLSRLGKYFKTKLVRVNQTIYRTQDSNFVIACAISRKYPDEKYWFGFTEKQFRQLKAARNAFAAFGCGNHDTIFLLPLADLEKWLPGINQTVNDSQQYWHIHIKRQSDRWMLLRKSDFDSINIDKYLM
ncbi:hypothetical protein EYB53_023115 [Candidatus Chloroploca sp. M-50]|uniref:Uncharacterized protein n=1 Tax=Candidatus Chloroploca mongolica TaxID=2528176 RepID=A0ABS4DGR9_9CHLR|nr:hypothetical protein [Candidatus Chloroploca mongolica]MBP1468623.1 hypothetical protein [Candidatus Chloroploca mongolica]